MTAANFAKCLEFEFGAEGGFVNHRDDPGGATNKGITKRRLEEFLGRKVSIDEVKNISHDLAARIYREGYWNVIQGDHLPDGFDLVAFDPAVNSGPVRGAKWFQKALGVVPDGKIGDITLIEALSATDGVKVIQKACSLRMNFLEGLRHWKTFGLGWSRRVAKVEAEAVAMYTQHPPRLLTEAEKADRLRQGFSKGAAASGGVGGVSSLSGVSDAVLNAAVFVAFVVAVVLVIKAIRNKHRAKAYRERANAR